MGRLRRFEENRFLGTRDDMRFYDCDEPGQFELIQAREEAEGLVARNLVAAIAPDTEGEARNRGFRAVATR